MSSVDVFQVPLTPAPQPVTFERVTPVNTAQTPVPAPANNPTIIAQTPEPNSAILPNTPISIQVAGATGRYAIGVRYPSGLYETAWDGQVFSPFYLGGSSLTAAPSGRQGYLLARTGGWNGAPELGAPQIDIITGF